MEISPRWDRRSFAAAQWRSVVSKPLSAFRLLALPVFVLVIACVFTAEGLSGGQPVNFSGVALVIAIFVLLPLALFQWRISRAFRRVTATTVTWSIGREGVTIGEVNPQGTSVSLTVPWDQVKKVSESAASFRFSRRKGAALLLPKTGLDESQLAQLRALLASSTATYVPASGR